jgi:hypothetical protein
MHFEIDLDPTHQVLRVTVTAVVATHELAEDCYRCVKRIASRGGPYAGIWDLSGVASTTESTDQIRDRAESDPAIPVGRTRVVVAKEPVIYGLSRMGQLMRDSIGGQLQVVHTLEEAYEIVGVRPEDFTERLFPEVPAAA